MHGYRLVSGGITRTVAGDPWHNLLMMSIKGGFTVPTDPVFVPTQFSCLRGLRWLRGLLRTLAMIQLCFRPNPFHSSNEMARDRMLHILNCPFAFLIGFCRILSSRDFSISFQSSP